VQLFRSICSSRLLSRVNIVLFMNKARVAKSYPGTYSLTIGQIDLLEAKLKAGIQVNQYIQHYGDRGNTPKAVTKCTYLGHAFAGQAR
jgi:hypothetical protein